MRQDAVRLSLVSVCQQMATASPHLCTCPDVSRRVTAACGRTPSAPVWCPSVSRQRQRHRVSLHVLMCHAVLQLRVAGRHPPQSGVRLSPAGGRRQRDRHRVSTCPDVSRRVTAACGRTPSAPVWCPSVAYWRTATARPSPCLYMS